MRYILFFSFILIAVLFGCSGDDRIVNDKIPPVPPVLIPHLGDTGDGNTNYYGGPAIPLDDENNGIDAYPDGDWIRLSWLHFLDTDLDIVRIYRFTNFNPIPVKIDSIKANNDYYLDNKTPLSLHVIYSYFIDLVDNSGNFSRSDTVSYALLGKQVLVSPANGASLSYNNIIFRWEKSGFVSKFRVIVFDENHSRIWHEDQIVSFEQDNFFTQFSPVIAAGYKGRTLYWRVDAFDWNSELDMYIGSESHERVFSILDN